MVSNLESLSAAELGRLVNEEKLDPEEVIEYFIRRIDEKNKDLNAFTYTKFDYARSEAKRLKARLASGEDIGPFAGVPFVLKDFLPSKKGWTASHGGVASRITVDEVDGEFTKAMEKAGGIAMGKANATTAVSNDDDGTEAETTTAFDNLGNAVNINNFLDQIASAFDRFIFIRNSSS